MTEPKPAVAGRLPGRFEREVDPSWAAVDRYLEAQLGLSDDALEAAVAASAAAGLPAIQVTPWLGRLLQMLAQSVGARRILEVGTLGGYSTIWLARGLPPDGRLVTLELEPHHAAVARTNLARAHLAEHVEVRVGRASDSLAKLAEERAGPFDLVFLDADKESYPDYLPWALRLGRLGTLIVADNVVRDGAVADPLSTDPRVVGVRRYLEKAAREPRLSTTVIPTVGSKGYDGFSVSRIVSG
jgi:predicted O-methyltransferase YrrM